MSIWIWVIIIAVVVVAGAAWWMMKKKKGPQGPESGGQGQPPQMPPQA